AFSPDGTRLATASCDNTARRWTADGKPIAVLEGHADAVISVAFSPDGTRLATASVDKTARLWSAEGKPIAVLEGHTDSVSEVAFSPDGTRLATASADNTARLWTAEGKPIAVLEGHTGALLSNAFSPDGTRLATASADNTARLWDLSILTLPPREAWWYAGLETGLVVRDDWEVQVEPGLSLPDELDVPSPGVPRSLVRDLAASPLREAAVDGALRFVTGGPDPAANWIALYRALEDARRPNRRRLIVLEELEASGGLDPILALAIVLTRTHGDLRWGDDPTRAAAVAELSRALPSAREANPNHIVVRTVEQLLK
ncbi:MAG: hypothetical protein HY720_01950, partial [Planctomycetes bacterium]|nr:hypothetical protein [Planctomycetota bacterium]